MLEQIKKTRLYEEIVKQMQGLIKNGTLKPGDKLPPERELALSLNVSRTAIREALRSLEMMGFIESKVGEGTYIRQITMNNVIDPFFSILSQDEKLILELYEVRFVLDVEIARLAAKRITPEKIEKIQQALNLMEAEVESGGKGIKGDDAFHAELANATENQVMIDIIRMCSDILSTARQATLDIPGHNLRALADHKGIFEAVQAGDEIKAANAMREHLIYGQNLYETKKLKK
ncbi:MAG: FadR/GntR family transcriptional regulator [Christensenellales bacterium]